MYGSKTVHKSFMLLDNKAIIDRKKTFNDTENQFSIVRTLLKENAFFSYAPPPPPHSPHPRLRIRSACTSTQSVQSFCWPVEEALDLNSFLKHSLETLISPCRCA